MRILIRWSGLASSLSLFLLLGTLSGCGATTKRGRTSEGRLTPTREPKEPLRTVGEFGKQGTGAGEMQEPVGIAVDQRSGDVYVVDTLHVRIEKFTSTGTFLLAWGWGVADGRTRALQTCRKRCFAGLAGAGSGQLKFPEGIAVDNDPSSASHGDVYVVDIHNHRVEKFDPGGRFLLAFGGGVNQTARRAHRRTDEDRCPVRRDDTCGAGIKGARSAELELNVEGSYIAVAPHGIVYVGDHNRLRAFSPGGRSLSQIVLTPRAPPIEGSFVGAVSGLAIDGTGNFYVIRNSIIGVNEYAPSGKLLRTLERLGKPAYPEGPTPALALDPAGNVYIDVYDNYTHRIDEFNSSGVRLASFDKGQKAPPGIADKEDGLPGMAYDSRTKDLYLLNADVNVTPVVERVRIVAPPRP